MCSKFMINEVSCSSFSLFCYVGQVFASMQDVLKTEQENPDRLLHNIQDLAQQLYHNVSWWYKQEYF